MTTQPITRNDLWVMNGADARTARQVTYSGEIGGGFVSLPDGGVLIVSRINQNWSILRMNLDGTGRKQVRSDEDRNFNPRATRDGRYILFTSEKNGRGRSVFRINSDGSGLTELAEMATLIDVSADGRWAYYHHVEGKERFISKVPVEGGPSIVVAKVDFGNQYAISQRDGRIAEFYPDAADRSASGGMRIYSAAGKELKRIPLTTIGVGALIHWTPDGKGVAYVDTRDERSNIWVIDADGKRPARPLTNFTSPLTGTFAFSLDGKKTFVTRPVLTSDAIMITNKGN
jgi:Tol biopolymer transport system component